MPHGNPGAGAGTGRAGGVGGADVGGGFSSRDVTQSRDGGGRAGGVGLPGVGGGFSPRDFNRARFGGGMGLERSPELGGHRPGQAQLAPFTWDQVPWPIRSMWMTQLFEQGGRLFNAVTGGLSELFEGLGSDPVSFDKPPEALGPGSQDQPILPRLPDTFDPLSQEQSVLKSVLGLRTGVLGLSR